MSYGRSIPRDQQRWSLKQDRSRGDRAARAVVRHDAKSGIVLAVDLRTVVALASRHAGVIEFVPRLAISCPRTSRFSRCTAVRRRSTSGVLRATVAMGPERTLEQDPMFAFRILVDIALKALSAAINDPTTAVLAIDQIHRLLRLLGKRQLRGELITDETGEPRMIFRTPNWSDFVHVACTEIRAYGAASMQIMRRLRAMLEDLLDSVPEHLKRRSSKSLCFSIARSTQALRWPRIAHWRGSPTCRGWADPPPRAAVEHDPAIKGDPLFARPMQPPQAGVSRMLAASHADIYKRFAVPRERQNG